MVVSSLDHVVINAKFDMDAVAACLTTLGFSLTAKGYHSLGSVNHLIMFDDHYLELVGLPLDTETLRREVLDSTIGIDGLVFKTDDAQATYDALYTLKFQVGEPQSFTRPVVINGNEEIARFRTTRLAAGEMPAGRVYFCEHLTPQWVFRPEWSVHRNGAKALVQLVIVSPNPSAEAARYADLTGGVAPPFELIFLTAAEYETRYGTVNTKGKQNEQARTRAAFFGAIVVEVDNVILLREQLEERLEMRPKKRLEMQLETPLERQTAAELAADGISVSDGVNQRTGAPSVIVSLKNVATIIEFVGPENSAVNVSGVVVNPQGL